MPLAERRGGWCNYVVPPGHAGTGPGCKPRLTRNAAMKATMPAPALLKFEAATAADLMAPNPISLRVDANVTEALALLTDKSISAAPVIDEAGHPVGVLSRSDILVHDRERPVK